MAAEEATDQGTLLELAIIDKEIAEENAEMLKGEIEDLKYQMNFMQKQLLDKFEEERLQFQITNEELVQAQSECEKKLKETEEICAGYKERIDVAIEVETSITLLTIRNAELEEKIQKLENDNRQLEELTEINAQIAETHKQGELAVLRDLEDARFAYREMKKDLQNEVDEKKKMLKTIEKFREFTEQLKKDIDDKDNQLKKNTEELRKIKDDEQFKEEDTFEVLEEAKEEFNDIIPTRSGPSEEEVQLIKQTLLENEKLSFELGNKKAEIIELKKLGKAKIDEIAILKCKIDLMQSQTNNAALLSEKVKQLEEHIQNSNLKVKELKKENEVLLNDISIREDTINTLETVNSYTGQEQIGECDVLKREIDLLELHLKGCEKSLRIYKLENMRLLYNKSIENFKTPDVISGPETLFTSKRDSRIDNLEDEALELRKQLIKYSVYFPDLTKSMLEQECDRQRFIANKRAIELKFHTLRSKLNTIVNEAIPF